MHTFIVILSLGKRTPIYYSLWDVLNIELSWKSNSLVQHEIISF